MCNAYLNFPVNFRDPAEPIEKDGQIGIAVIGCGNIARSHLDAIKKIPEFRLVATVDILKGRAESYAKAYGAERYYTSYLDALEDPNVEAVSICLPHVLHARVAIEAAERKKHIITEKPMATNLDDAYVMVKAASRNHVILMVEQTLRFRGCNLKVRELLRKGVIGEPRHAIRRRLGYSKSAPVSWANKPEVAGGWVLYGFGSHEVDISLWHLESSAEKVYAMGAKNNPYWNDYDEVSIHMKLTNGSILTVQLSLNCQQSCWDSIIIGTEGSINVREAKEITLGKDVIPTPLKPWDGIPSALKEFASSILEGREPEASGRDVLKTMWALEAAKLSIRSGRVVTKKDLPYPAL